jgi:MFS family permease
VSLHHSSLFANVQRKVFGLVGALVITAFAGLGGMFVFDGGTHLNNTFKAKIEVATKALLREVSRKPHGENQVADLESTFTKLRTRAPELTYIAVMDHGRTLLLETGLRPAGLSTLKTNVAKQVIGNQDVHVSRLTLTPESGSLYVLIGVEADFIHHRLSEQVMVWAATLLGLLWIAYEIVNTVLNTRLHSPLQTLQTLMGRIGAGDFRAGIPSTRSKLFGGLTEVLNNFTKRVNGHFSVMGVLAADLEAESSADNQLTRKRLGAHMAQLLNRFHFAEGGQLPSLVQASPSAIRLPLFLFTVTETLSYAVLPKLAQGFYDAGDQLALNLFTVLPVAVAIGGALLGSTISVYGFRRYPLKTLSTTSAVLMFAGFVGASQSTTMEGLMFWRALSGFGFGMVAAACQNYVSLFASDENFSEQMKDFVLPLMSGGIVGVTMGGILQGYADPPLLFGISALGALLTGLLSFGPLNNVPAPASEGPADDPFPVLKSLSRNPRLILFGSLSVLPAQIILGGFCFFLAPVYLTELGLDPMETGSILAFIFLIILVLTPPVARLADKYGLTLFSMCAGFVMMGAMAISLIQWQNALTVITVAGGIGIGQSLLIAPSLAALPRLAPDIFSAVGVGPVLSFHRLVVGLGLLAGAVGAALLSDAVGHAMAIYYLGWLSFIIAAVFGLTFAILRLQPPQQDEPLIK